MRNRITFTTKNSEDIDVIVCLSSSIPDEYFPPIKGTTRCESLFHLLIFEPQKDGSTMIQCFSQIDPKLEAIAIVTENKLIVKKSQEWYDSLTKYLDSQISETLYG